MDQYFVGNGPEVSSPLSVLSSRFEVDSCLQTICLDALLQRPFARAQRISFRELTDGSLEARWRLIAGLQRYADALTGRRQHTTDLALSLRLQGAPKAEPKRQRGAGVEHGQSQCVVLSHFVRRLDLQANHSQLQILHLPLSSRRSHRLHRLEVSF